MASSVVALFRYKADMERSVSHVGGEGLLMLSVSATTPLVLLSELLMSPPLGLVLQRRSVVMSLPLVFLTYAVAALVAGVALYACRDASLAGPAYARWTVYSVMGGLVGVLTMSALLARR